MNLRVSCIKQISFRKNDALATDLHYLSVCVCVCVCSSGMSEPDYNLYPSREMQLDWLHTYLQAYKLFTKKGEEVSQSELETLYVQVNKFALVSVACVEDIRGENVLIMQHLWNWYMVVYSKVLDYKFVAWWLLSVIHLCVDWAGRLSPKVLVLPLWQASHFFWGFWALIQAKYSSIEFDFLG